MTARGGGTTLSSLSSNESSSYNMSNKDTSSSILRSSSRDTAELLESERKSSIFRSSRDFVVQSRMNEFTSNRLRILDEEEEKKKKKKGGGGRPGRRRALVLVKGYSGTGKTALVSSLRNHVIQRLNGFYASGKFDLYVRDEPYYGIASAFRAICGEIIRLRTKEDATTTTANPTTTKTSSTTVTARSFVQIHDILIEKLGYTNIYLLTKVIPEIEEIIQLDGVGDGDDNFYKLPNNIKNENNSNNCNLQENKAKLHYVFRIFIRLVTSFFGTLVLVIDDLQWADSASLELMEVLMTDRENHGFMIIGLYRSNEVDGSQLLSKMISDLKKEESDYDDFEITELEVGNLTVDAVKSVTMDMLGLDDNPRTLELAELCHKRTSGNVFFLISFIKMLEEEGLVQFDLHLHSYTWNMEKIKSETAASSNVVDLMRRKMENLPSSFGRLLSMAACLGSSFDQSKLELIWNKFVETTTPGSPSPSSENDCSIEEKLSLIVEEGLLEKPSSDNPSNYRWIHDKVQEAAFTIIPPSESNAFKYQVGDILCQHMSKGELDTSIFLVVSLLNAKSGDDSLGATKRIRLAQLNLHATKKAMGFSAFSSATKYTTKGIELLPVDRWTSHYRLTLELYSYAAEAEDFIGGEDEKMQSYCDEVLNQTTRPLADKLRVYNVLVSNMANSGKHIEAVSLVLEVLGYLGCKFPRSSPSRLVGTLAGLIRAKSSLKLRTSEEIDKMKIMTDPIQIERIKLLDKLSTYTYLCGSDLCPLAIMKNTRLTLRHGLCEYSPPAFASIAMILTGVLGDLDAGSKLGEYALLLLEKLQSRNPLSRTKFVVYTFVFTWTKPFNNLLKIFLEAYENGMSSGDTESAMYSIFMYIMISYLSGRSLDLVRQDCSIYSKQMAELKRQQAFDYTLVFWQQSLNLMGLSEHTTTLQGDVVKDAEEFLKLRIDNPPMVAIFRTHQLRLYTTFGEHEQGANLFIGHGYDWPKVAPAHPMFMEAVFCGGLSSFAVARTTRKRKFKNQANKALTTIKGWVRKGNPNVKHHEALLSAESFALSKRYYEAAEKSYQSAITMAARGGFVHDAALANERYGEFKYFVQYDKEGAAYYFNKAIEFYTEWGAMKKVEFLQERYEHILSFEQQKQQREDARNISTLIHTTEAASKSCELSTLTF